MSKITRQQQLQLSQNAAIMEELIMKICKQQADIIGKQLDERLNKFENSLKAELKVNTERIDTLERRLNEQEQINKANNLIVHGVPEEQNEDLSSTEEKLLNLFRNKLNLEISSNEVDKCYRIGKRKDGKSRSILVRFISHKTKTNVFNKKKLLKKTGFVIKEDLTVANLELVKLSIDIYGISNVWTQNGRVFVMENNVKRNIRSINELKQI